MHDPFLSPGPSLGAADAVAAPRADAWVLPTELPCEAEPRAAMQAALDAKAPECRSPEDWKFLALLALARAAEQQEDVTCVQEAATLVRCARAVDPDDAELQAAEGSVTCLKAKSQDLSRLEALWLAQEGFRKLDEAVARHGAELGPRLMRAVTFLRAPSFLGKAPVAEADLNFVAARMPTGAEHRALNAMVLFLLGVAQDANGYGARAREAWTAAAALDVPDWSERAASKLL